MGIKATGHALVSSSDEGAIYRIEADELDWQAVGSDERSMGAAVLHEATVDHEELGELKWTVSEYPLETVDHVIPEMNGHLLLEDFNIWYEHEYEPDDEDGFYVSPGPIEISEDELKAANRDRQVEMLVAWFRSRFDDPSQETPYNGREGGFLYVHGGPYDAADELHGEFSGAVDEKIIDAAVEEVESDGISEWAPIRYGAPDDDYELEPQSFAELEHALRSITEPQRMDERLETARSNTIANATAFLEALRDRRVAHGSMGHNGPPLDDREQVLPIGLFDELEAATEKLLVAVSKTEPDIFDAAQAGMVLEQRLAWMATTPPQSSPIDPPALAPDAPEVPEQPDKPDGNWTKFKGAFSEQMGKNAAHKLSAATGGGTIYLMTLVPGLQELVATAFTFLRALAGF